MTGKHNTTALAGDGLILDCRDVAKQYQQGNTSVAVLNDINLQLQRGQSMAIIGVSGSGKSTLLNLLGGLDQPSRGQVFINGQCLATLDERDRARLRNCEIGFVYQLHHLLMEFTALENTAMPLLIRGLPASEAQAKAADMLQRVGLSHRLNHKPSALSGGERQRVAIARALVTSPSCVLMDEPTGNLDSQSAAGILELIRDLQQSLQLSFVVVTHDLQLAQRIGRVYQLKDGCLSPLATAQEK